MQKPHIKHALTSFVVRDIRLHIRLVTAMVAVANLSIGVAVMAMIDTPRTAPFGAISTFRATTFLMNTVETVTSAIVAYIEHRRTVQALNELSPRMMEDIGITHADIETFRSGGALR